MSRRPQIGRWLRAVVLGVAASLASVAVLATSGWLVLRAAERPPVLALLAAIVVVRALGLVRSLGRYGERLASHDAVLRHLPDERVRWYRRLAPRVGSEGLASAALLTRFTADVDALANRPLRVVLPAIVAAVTALAIVVAATAILPAAGAVLAAGLLVGGLGGPALSWVLARRALQAQGAERGRFAALLAEALEQGPQLAVAGQGPARLATLRGASGALARADRSAGRAAAAGVALTSLGTGLALVGTLVLGAAAAARGDLEPVWLGALVLLAVGGAEAVGALPEAALELVRARAARERLDEAVAGPVRTPEPATPRPLPTVGELVARDVVHRPGGPGAPAVLDGLTLRVAPGEHVAVVGPSGAGKSTLAALLTRLADPSDAGAVTYGGVALREAAGADVRARVRLAGQDAHLLATSLAANVRVGAPEATDAEVAGALRTAGLGAWLDGLPDGLATLVGEDGVEVSGGQRQRIALARALASPARVLVLDEPTAMLDPGTARAVLDDVLAAAGDRALVVVTHDRAGLERFDRVLELRAGRLELVG